MSKLKGFLIIFMITFITFGLGLLGLIMIVGTGKLWLSILVIFILIAIIVYTIVKFINR